MIQRTTRGHPLANQPGDPLWRSAVERNFDIIGEALNRMDRADPAAAGRLPERAAIIRFRNGLIHGYDDSEHSRVWKTIGPDVPRLKGQVEQLTKAAESEEPKLSHNESGQRSPTASAPSLRCFPRKSQLAPGFE